MVWAVQYAILYVCVCECICVGREQAKRERGDGDRGGETDKQSESKGVAQSDKLDLMNEPSSKK